MIYTTRAVSSLVLVTGVLAAPHQAAAQAETTASTLYRESYALEAKHEYAAALAKMRDLTRTSGKTYFSTVRAAWLAYLAGDFVASQSEYAAAIALEPRSVEPRLGLTLPLLAARNWKELERASREALVLDPRNATAQARLAAALYWENDFANAVTAYRQLVADYPSDLDYRTGLGWALLKLGRAAEAKPIFEGVLMVSPDNANAKRGLTGR